MATVTAGGGTRIGLSEPEAETKLGSTLPGTASSGEQQQQGASGDQGSERSEQRGLLGSGGSGVLP